MLAFSALLWYNIFIKGGEIMGGNYEKGLFNQLQETMLAVEKLTSEISTQKRNYEAKIDELTQRIDSQAVKITALEKENQKLRDIIDKNSGNSSKPPSSDAFVKIQNSREKAGRPAWPQRKGSQAIRQPNANQGHQNFKMQMRRQSGIFRKIHSQAICRY